MEGGVVGGMGDGVGYRALPRLDPEGLNAYLKSIYYDAGSSGGFSTPEDLYRTVRERGEHRVTSREVREWLLGQQSYAAFKTVKRRFPRPRVVVSEKNGQWDVDCLNMGWYKEWNRDYAYVLVCVDVFTRFAFTRPLLTVRAEAVKKAFEDIFLYNQRPRSVRSDRGTEFVNAVMKSFFRSNGVHHFLTNNEIKTSHCERLIKTLRLRIGRMIRGKRSFNWVDHLEAVTQAYNETTHRSIGTTPLRAMCVEEKAELWHRQYLRNDEATRTGPNADFSLKVGGRVRLSYQSKAFHRNYDENWSRAVYTVTSRRLNQGYEAYKLKSYDNEAVLGEFSQHELQRVVDAEPERFEIERVIKHRTVGPRNARRRQAFVRWMGYKSSYDSWIPAEDVKDLV